MFLLKLLSHAGHRRLELGLALERACVSVGQAGKGMRQRVRHTVVSTSAPSHSRPLVCGVAYTHTHTHTHTRTWEAWLRAAWLEAWQSAISRRTWATASSASLRPLSTCRCSAYRELNGTRAALPTRPCPATTNPSPCVSTSVQPIWCRPGGGWGGGRPGRERVAFHGVRACCPPVLVCARVHNMHQPRGAGGGLGRA